MVPKCVKKRRKKDPSAPKKAKSGYIVFLERHRKVGLYNLNPADP